MSNFQEPPGDTADPAALFAGYLDLYRETVVRKVASLPEQEARRSRLGSGWTPVELLNHLAHMERRWLVRGFLGEEVEDPWGDEVDGRWHVPDETPLDEVVAMLRSVGQRTGAILGEHPLDEPAQAELRVEETVPTLAWICFHVLQEYARHAGHLDVAVELAGGDVGE